MCRIIAVCLLMVLVLGCSSIQKFIGREKSPDELPLIVGNHDIASTEKPEVAAQDGEVMEGMTCEMVEKSWGIPDKKDITESGFVVWEYGREKLYFLEDVLVSMEKK